MISNRIIFISPLDWGLGHASRCVPIIQKLKNDNKIFIGVSDLNAAFFEHYFPDLKKIRMPSYNISYSKKVPLWLKLVFQWPKVKRIISEENKELKTLVDLHDINLVISDNRFGLFNKNIECIFLTHQLQLQSPFSLGIADIINKKFIHRFNKVWVPDYEEKDLRLAGRLSDPEGVLIPVKYIGPQSALTLLPEAEPRKKSDVLILLSGPEPQRTVLENLLIDRFKNVQGKVVLVRGSDLDLKEETKNMKVINYAYGSELRNLIVNAETVICRSGYSTLMDLHLLGKEKLFLIPTPGQTEQEYLANYWHKHFHSNIILQGDIRKHDFISAQKT